MREGKGAGDLILSTEVALYFHHPNERSFYFCHPGVRRYQIHTSCCHLCNYQCVEFILSSVIPADAGTQTCNQ
jgi:hypothetical protein